MTVSNIGGSRSSFSYTVKIFDPAVTGDAQPATPALLSPADASVLGAGTVTLTWFPADKATSYDVYFGACTNRPLLANTPATSYDVSANAAGTYCWKIASRNGHATASSGVRSFTTIGGSGLSQPQLTLPANGAQVPAGIVALSWAQVSGATSYDVYAGTDQNPPLIGNTQTTSFNFTAINGTTVYWKVAAKNSGGTAMSSLRAFSVGDNAPANGLGFVAITPCRVIDTRGSGATTFGPPTLAAGAVRSFPFSQSSCNLPGSAKAFSVNVTVVPNGPLGYLTVWPTGQPQPYVSTLNSPSGIVTANAAIVPAGSNGSISFYSTNDTELIVDVNGYFTSDPLSSVFFTHVPCRVTDTRETGARLTSANSVDISVQLGACSAPPSATAYSVNVTAVPMEGLGYLSLWPTGQAFPNVSTLNSPDGRVVANAAIVPAGSGGSIRAGARNQTDFIVDLNGMFGPRAAEGLLFYPVQPCRAADTRGESGQTGAFGLPRMNAGSSRNFPLPSSGCGLPASAKAYSLNVTVVPKGPLGYLSIWPTGQSQPFVSTLNAPNGNVLANAAIVPAGSSGSISVYVTDNTDVILDVNGYFAP